MSTFVLAPAYRPVAVAPRVSTRVVEGGRTMLITIEGNPVQITGKGGTAQITVTPGPRFNNALAKNSWYLASPGIKPKLCALTTGGIHAIWLALRAKGLPTSGEHLVTHPSLRAATRPCRCNAARHVRGCSGRAPIYDYRDRRSVDESLRAQIRAARTEIKTLVPELADVLIDVRVLRDMQLTWAGSTEVLTELPEELIDIAPVMYSKRAKADAVPVEVLVKRTQQLDLTTPELIAQRAAREKARVLGWQYANLLADRNERCFRPGWWERHNSVPKPKSGRTVPAPFESVDQREHNGNLFIKQASPVTPIHDAPHAPGATDATSTSGEESLLERFVDFNPGWNAPLVPAKLSEKKHEEARRTRYLDRKHKNEIKAFDADPAGYRAKQERERAAQLKTIKSKRMRDEKTAKQRARRADRRANVKQLKTT